MGCAELGQVFTKRFIADYMVTLFTLASKSSVLDPCFGEGVFIDSILAHTDYYVFGYEIDSALFEKYLSSEKNADLKNRDFLLSKHDRKYDGIIMNPPYIRHEKIDDLAGYGIVKEALLQEPVFLHLPKTANLYMYFIIKAIDLLKPNGELIVIFPETWLTARGGVPFKSLIEENCSIVKRIHVNGNAFEKEALVDVVILKLIKMTRFIECAPTYVTIDNHTIKEQSRIRLEMSSDSKVGFHEYASVRRGLTTGWNAMFINPDISGEEAEPFLKNIISSPKMVKGYSTVNAQTDRLLVIAAESALPSVITGYLANYREKIRSSRSPKTLASKIENGEAWYLLSSIDCEGIWFGYMVRQDMRFILNEGDSIARDNFYVISPRIDKYLLFALLNNYYTYTQLEISGKKYGAGLLKLQKYDIQAIQFPDIHAMSADDIAALAELGKKLATESNKAMITEITEILSKYEAEDCSKIMRVYAYLCEKRLEQRK